VTGPVVELIVELKCLDRFANKHLAQCVNHWKVSGLRVALLINFQKPRVEWKRILVDTTPGLQLS
jgi:GxxExxY protein